MTASNILLEVKDLVVHFTTGRKGLFDRTEQSVKAVNSMSLSLHQGQTLGLVGESGSGKSTFGRAILRLGELTSGSVKFNGKEVATGKNHEIAWLRRETAMIFQDPYGALNPRMTVAETIGEVLRVHHKVTKAELTNKVEELLTLVGLDKEFAARIPAELSGGQCQRVGIARALAIEPRLIIADECVAALDVSIQGQVINLLIDLRDKMGLSMIFIAHDLAVVRSLCDRVAVMYLGRVVEEGPTDQVFSDPKHPYTLSLIRAIPDVDPDKQLCKEFFPGEPPSSITLPHGCAFHPRCPIVEEKCQKGAAPSLKGAGEHRSACIFPNKIDLLNTH